MELIFDNKFMELNNDELNEVDGGAIPWLAIAGGVGAAWVLYEIGYAVGKGIAHATS